MKNKQIIITILSIIILTNYSCNENSFTKESSLNSNDSNFEIEDEIEPMFSVGQSKKDIEEQSTSSNDKSKNVSHNRKLIKNGSIGYKTEDMSKSRLVIEKLIKKHNAFISNETSNNDDYNLNTDISIRIPNENFDLFLADLSGTVKEFDFKNINVKDVTEEYVDIKSRLKAKIKLEESFLVLLKKAQKIKSILEIEKEINIVRTDIERMQGRLRYLSDRVSLSTLNISFYKKIPREYKQEKGFFGKLWYNFQSGFDGLLQFILGIVTIWPFLILITVAIFFIKRFIHKKMK